MWIGSVKRVKQAGILLIAAHGVFYLCRGNGCFGTFRFRWSRIFSEVIREPAHLLGLLLLVRLVTQLIGFELVLGELFCRCLWDAVVQALLCSSLVLA